MRVRILKVPPASKLEGLDLRQYRLKEGEIRALRSPVADVLMAWGYATEVEPAARPTKTPVRVRRK